MGENRQRKEDKRCQKSRQAIKYSLLLLLHEKSAAAITISELAAAANINRKTFYNHYDSIADVIDELENDLLDRLFGFVDRNPIHGIGDPTAFFGRIFDAIKSNTADFRLLIQSGAHLNLIAGFRSRIGAIFDGFLSRCEESDRDVMVYLLDYICSGVVSVLERWSCDCKDDELERLSAIVGAMINATVKGLGEAVVWKSDFLKTADMTWEHGGGAF